MCLQKRYSLLLFFASCLFTQDVIAFEGNANFLAACEAVRLEMILQDAALKDNPNLECRKTYNPDKPPALPIYITVADCLERCPGYEMSKQNVLNQWVGPLVGFLLPALAFVISIPRPLRVPRNEEWFGLRKWKAIPWLFVALFLTSLDILFWIIAVFAFAGPLIAGSIHEAVIDHIVLDHAQTELAKRPDAAMNAIAFSLLGSLKPLKGNLEDKVRAYITDSPFAKTKLEALLDHLPSYGTRVGTPIVFYLGAYAYALFDAKSKLGDNDTAHAVAFGLWYGVVVLVAIVSSSVLGIDNPANLHAIFSENRSLDTESPGTNSTSGSNTNVAVRPFLRIDSHAYHFHDSPYRMVWLWKRARVFQEWLKTSRLDDKLKTKVIANTPRFVSGVFSSILISLPCAGACWISYQTPAVGFGCRSVAHLIYATSQILLIMVWWTYYSSPHSIRLEQSNRRFTPGSILVYVVTALALAAALISSIGGTIMQLVGVFRNCICKASLMYLLPKYRSQGVVLLSNDLQEHRDNAKWWNIVGLIGVVFVGILSIVGWMYQWRVRSKARRLVRML